MNNPDNGRPGFSLPSSIRPSTMASLLSIAIAMTSMAEPVNADSMLVTLPDWNDEDAAYHDPERGLNIAADAPEHIQNGNYSANELANFADPGDFDNTELHEDTEGDDLWIAYHMWKRLEGIKPNDVWRDRVNSLKDFYINSYVATLTGPGRETDNNYDHLYGWGLCDWYRTEGQSEPDGGAAALNAIDGIVRAMVDWNAVYQGGIGPGDSILNNSNGGRRWARQLRFAVCAAEVSPKAENVAWRDRVIDIILQAPEFDPEYRMYFYTSGETVKKGFDYDAGERVINTFHMGLWSDAMWHAWRVLKAESDPRQATMRQRIVNIATYYRDYGPDPDGRVPLLTGLNVTTGARLDTSSTGYGNTGVYTIPPVNGLVFAYKLTGSDAYLDAAWDLWLRFQESEGGQPDTIFHYADSQLSSANAFRLLRHNKGELPYVYALFENGGSPTVLGDAIAPSPPTNLQAN